MSTNGVVSTILTTGGVFGIFLVSWFNSFLLGSILAVLQGWASIIQRKKENAKREIEKKKKEVVEKSRAATKLQAGFRGTKARRDVDKIKKKKLQERKEREIQMTREAEEQAVAATKLQAGFIKQKL